MKLRVKGKPYNISKAIVGIVTSNPNDCDESKILISDEFESTSYFAAYLSQNKELKTKITKNAIVYNLPYIDHLSDGDIVAISSDGNISTLYRSKANANFLLLTERCNSNCLMCSQPPKNRNDINYLTEINKQVISLMPKNLRELGLTGGEPTLLGEHFFDLMNHIMLELPDTEIHILTNGRTFEIGRAHV